MKLKQKVNMILFMDSDVIIKKNCPDLFEYIPADHIGTIYEDKGSREKDRYNRIKKIQLERGDIGWRAGYINTGVFLLPKEYSYILECRENLWLDFGFDDVELGYRMQCDNIPVYELPFQFNHMSMHSEEWNNKASRFDSYIIHYAGNGFIRNLDRTLQIKQDYELLKRYGEVV